MDTIKPVEETDQDQTSKTYVVTSYKLEGESTLKTSLADTREPVTGASEQIDDDNDLPPEQGLKALEKKDYFKKKSRKMVNRSLNKLKIAKMRNKR